MAGLSCSREASEQSGASASHFVAPGAGSRSPGSGARRSRISATTDASDVRVRHQSAKSTRLDTANTRVAVKKALNAISDRSTVVITTMNDTADPNNGKANVRNVELGPPSARRCKSASVTPYTLRSPGGTYRTACSRASSSERSATIQLAATVAPAPTGDTTRTEDRTLPGLPPRSTVRIQDPDRGAVIRPGDFFA